MYVILSSNKSTNYFPQNKPYKFKSHLSAPLVLDGTWKVALVETDITSSLSKTDPLYLHSNICDESIVDGDRKPLLRRLTSTDVGSWSDIFPSPHYVPVKTKDIYEIEISISDDKDNLSSFIDQPSTVTLHFKSFPFS